MQGKQQIIYHTVDLLYKYSLHTTLIWSICKMTLKQKLFKIIFIFKKSVLTDIFTSVDKKTE